MDYKNFTIICEYDQVEHVIESFQEDAAVLSMDVYKARHTGSTVGVVFNASKEQARLAMVVAGDKADAFRDSLLTVLPAIASGEAVMYVASIDGVQTA